MRQNRLRMTCNLGCGGDSTAEALMLRVKKSRQETVAREKVITMIASALLALVFAPIPMNTDGGLDDRDPLSERCPIRKGSVELGERQKRKEKDSNCSFVVTSSLLPLGLSLHSCEVGESRCWAPRASRQKAMQENTSDGLPQQSLRFADFLVVRLPSHLIDAVHTILNKHSFHLLN